MLLDPTVFLHTSQLSAKLNIVPQEQIWNLTFAVNGLTIFQGILRNRNNINIVTLIVIYNINIR